MAKSQTSWPRFIQVNPLDNVAIVATVGGLRAGTLLGSECPLLEDIPEGHKVALADVEAGGPRDSVRRDDWVRLENRSDHALLRIDRGARWGSAAERALGKP
jgi:hypothetical protein